MTNQPVETLIYTAHVAKKPIYIRTPDGKTWIVADGKMQVDTSKPSRR